VKVGLPNFGSPTILFLLNRAEYEPPSIKLDASFKATEHTNKIE
jgi:hypothetical protein